MRLLNTKTLQLEEFQVPPEYAILSHTWDEEEVTLQDIEQGTERSKKGWNKILQCCEVCAGDGWSYVWIDTCCIDKKSSAELSEAVNSMFLWYQKAVVCYAYLSDVVLKRNASLSNQFVDSRWFTRGWTLQELIGPSYLVFLAGDWSKIGTRAYLSSLVEKATSITPSHIANYRSCSIARKMSWAARRTTTRIEDQAYCLMGLFDVNMPLLYGEGQKAFLRLQFEILKNSDDESIFAWTGPYKTDAWDRLYHNVSGLLAPSPSLFHDSAEIEPFVFDSTRTEYAMTNKGLSITLETWQYIGNGMAVTERAMDHLVPLNCRFKNRNNPVAISLLHEGEESYVRADPHQLTQWNETHTESRRWELTPKRKLYVRQVDEYTEQAQATQTVVWLFHFDWDPWIRLIGIREYWHREPHTAANIVTVDNTYSTAGEYRTLQSNFQCLFLLEVPGKGSTHHLTVCVTTYNDFLALSLFPRQEGQKNFSSALEAAQIKLKRAQDSVSAPLLNSGLFITVSLRPISSDRSNSHDPKARHVALRVSQSDGRRVIQVLGDLPKLQTAEEALADKPV